MIDRAFNSIIALKNINYFSAVEIRTAVIAVERDEQLVPADVRRFVYEELVKLVAWGWLKKKTSEKKGISRYSKTDLFSSHYFLDLLAAENKLTVVINEKAKYQYELKVRLSSYNAELLEGLGAIKEYVSLKEIYPDLHPLLKNKYFIIQEKNQILKGKISALEDLLSLQ